MCAVFDRKMSRTVHLHVYAVLWIVFPPAMASYCQVLNFHQCVEKWQCASDSLGPPQPKPLRKVIDSTCLCSLIVLWCIRYAYMYLYK